MDYGPEGNRWDFDPQAARYDEIVSGESFLYARYDKVLDAVAGVASVAKGERVLDIGVGTGNLAGRFLRRGAHVVGLDPSEGMLARARSKFGGNQGLELHQARDPFIVVPFPGAAFDAVVSTYAWHHVPPRLKPRSLNEMVRVLKPGGVLAIGDLMFESEDAETEALRTYPWLEEEHFVRLDGLAPLFAERGMTLACRQFTPVTWVIWGRSSGQDA